MVAHFASLRQLSARGTHRFLFFRAHKCRGDTRDRRPGSAPPPSEASTSIIRVRFQRIGHARIQNVGESQSCMVSKLLVCAGIGQWCAPRERRRVFGQMARLRRPGRHLMGASGQPRSAPTRSKHSSQYNNRAFCDSTRLYTCIYIESYESSQSCMLFCCCFVLCVLFFHKNIYIVHCCCL